jgi:hypothetical protein
MGNRTSRVISGAPAGAPIVVTGTAEVMVASFGGSPLYGATLNGTVNANNADATVSFEYGLTTAYGSTVDADPATVTGIATMPVTGTLAMLTPNTYHYRIKAVNSKGTSYGGDQSFTAAVTAPKTTAAPRGGTYNAPVDVTLTATDALTILYSVDGTDPSLPYSTPIHIATTTTLKFMALGSSGFEPVQIETYTISLLPVMVDNPSGYFSTIQDAYQGAATSAVIKATTQTFNESPSFNQSKAVTFRGGYDSAFSSNSGAMSTLNGTLSISAGCLTVEHLCIR